MLYFVARKINTSTNSHRFQGPEPGDKKESPSLLQTKGKNRLIFTSRQLQSSDTGGKIQNWEGLKEEQGTSHPFVLRNKNPKISKFLKTSRSRSSNSDQQ